MTTYAYNAFYPFADGIKKWPIERDTLDAFGRICLAETVDRAKREGHTPAEGNPVVVYSHDGIRVSVPVKDDYGHPQPPPLDRPPR